MTSSNVIDARQLFDLRKLKTITDKPGSYLVCHPDSLDDFNSMLPGYMIMTSEVVKKNTIYAVDYKALLEKIRPIRSKE